MKIALGMIIRSLDTDEELMRFIDNADEYGHKIDCLIVAYTQYLNPRAADNISRRVPLFAIDIRNPGFCNEQFRRRGMSPSSVSTLLECPVDSGRGLMPYGFKRTIVTIEAILRGIDILFFVDSDVSPAVLAMTPDGPSTISTDFFGTHLEYLKSGSQITTGEYSGYNILPPASFDGMEDLLDGLQKSDMLGYWQSSGTHRCLRLQAPERMPVPCTKILGGNTAIRLSVFSDLPPFFSSSYIAGDELFLCRGEDTVLGLGIAKNGTVCTDIELNPLHDTYQSYPDEPDLRSDPRTQERFYYACTGWVGRNPLYNYMCGKDVKETREYQHERLERGLRALSAYTSNPRFNSVLRNFNVSWDNLNRYVGEYKRVLEAWDEFIETFSLKQVSN